MPQSARNQLITVRASFQGAAKHTVNGFSLGTNEQIRPLGKTQILHHFLAFLRESLKPLWFFTGGAGTSSSPEEKMQVPLRGTAVGKPKLLLLFVRAKNSEIK